MFCAPLALALVYFTGHPVVAAVAVVAAAMLIDTVIAQDTAKSGPSPSPVAVAVYSAPAQPERPQAPALPSTMNAYRVRVHVAGLNAYRAWYGPRPMNATPVYRPGPAGVVRQRKAA